MPASPDLPTPVPEPVPEWARAYDAAEFPRQAVTGDAVALALHWRGGACALRALVVERGAEPYAGLDAWPGGFLDWGQDHDARQAAIRELREETGADAPAYVEPLGSYSRIGRDPRQFAGTRDERTGAWVARGARVTTVAYLMLMRTPATLGARGTGDDAAEARWTDVHAYLPWEDVRDEAGQGRARALAREMDAWAAGDPERRDRVRHAFGFGLSEWNEERTADRLALLREARRVPEARRDAWGRSSAEEGDAAGREMAFDHREILADALGRLRGKIKYMPAALVALTGGEVTLDELQAACEAIAGRRLHRPNFRRAVAPPAGGGQPRTPRLVAGTGRRRAREGGGPGVDPEIFRFRDDAVRARLETSLRLPWLPLAGGE